MMQYFNQNIYLIGGMGAGKTTIGRKLAETIAYDFYDLDKEIEDTTGVDISWIFELEGEAGFRLREHLMLEQIAHKERIVLATGGGSILDPQNREILRQHGLVIYLKTSIDHQVSRLMYDKRRPLLQHKDKEQVLRDLMQKREQFYQDTAHLIVETGAKPMTKVVQDLIDSIEKLA